MAKPCSCIKWWATIILLAFSFATDHPVVIAYYFPGCTANRIDTQDGTPDPIVDVHQYMAAARNSKPPPPLSNVDRLTPNVDEAEEYPSSTRASFETTGKYVADGGDDRRGNHHYGIVMLLVSTHNGHLSGIEINLNEAASLHNHHDRNECVVELNKLWQTKLIHNQPAVYHATANSPTLTVHGKPMRLLPSLQGGLFTILNGKVKTLPFTSDSILSSNFRFSENITAIGTKTSEIIKIDLLQGKVLFRTDLTAESSSPCSKASEISDLYMQENNDKCCAPHLRQGGEEEVLTAANEDGILQQSSVSSAPLTEDGQVLTAISSVVLPGRTCAATFKHVTRKVKAVDYSSAQVKWKFSTVDITSLTSSSCEAPYEELIRSSERSARSKESAGGLPIGIDDLVQRLKFSLHDGVICTTTTTGTGTGISSSAEQCVRLGSPMVRAWVAIAARNGSKISCMQELDLLALSYATEVDKNVDLTDGAAEDTKPASCPVHERNADRMTIKRRGSINCVCNGSTEALSPLMYIGRNGGGGADGQMYAQVSDHNFMYMVGEAKRKFSEEQQQIHMKQHGFLSADMFFSVFDATGSTRNHGRKLAVVIPHDDPSQPPPGLFIDKNKTGHLIPIHGLPVINYETTAGIFILTDHEVFRRCENMHFSRVDSAVWAVVSLSCLFFGFLSFASTNAQALLCSATPILKCAHFLNNVFEFILLFILRLVVQVKAYRRPLNGAVVDQSEYLNAQLKYLKSRTTKQEILRWLNVRFTSKLLSSYQSRYETEYRHVGCLGKGGFGVVFEAVNRLDHRRVAVKRIKFNSSIDTEVVQEIRFLAQLAYPHVVYYHCAWYEVPPFGWQKEKDKVLLTRSKRRGTSTAPNTTTDLISDVVSTRPISSSTEELSLSVDNQASYSQDGEERSVEEASGGNRVCAAAQDANDSNSFQVIFSNNSTAAAADCHSSDQCSSSDNGLQKSSTTTDESCDIFEESTHSGSFGVDFDVSYFNGDNDYSVRNRHLQLGAPNRNSFVGSSTSSGGKGMTTSGSGKNGYTRSHSGKRTTSERSTNLLPQKLDATKLSEAGNQERPGYLYFCMELCQPDTLREWLETHNDSQRSMNDAIWYFMQICNGVHYIHTCNLIHRDLKPSNIFFSLTDRSLVKIGDFGLMTYLQDPANQDATPQALNVMKNMEVPSGATPHGPKVVGTELYISPEQYKNSCLPNQSVDIYALGIILFELLYPFSTKMERVMTLRCLRDFCMVDGTASGEISLAMMPSVGKAGGGSAMYGKRELDALLKYQKSHILEWGVVKWLLSKQPSQRPTVSELLQSSEFMEMSFKYLDKERFDQTGWRRARCTSSSQTL